MSYDTVNNLFDLWKETNAVTNDIFSYAFIFSTFILIYMVLYNFDAKNVFAASAFVTSVIAFLMFVAQLIPAALLIFSLVLLVSSLAWIRFAEN